MCDRKHEKWVGGWRDQPAVIKKKVRRASGFPVAFRSPLPQQRNGQGPPTDLHQDRFGGTRLARERDGRVSGAEGLKHALLGIRSNSVIS